MSQKEHARAAKWQKKWGSLAATCRAHVAPRVPSPGTQKFNFLSRASIYLELREYELHFLK